ncbi:bifunctional indole-3-glycerol-phosphate synthase TrpC/phosphoribosylanthranilate isomerase TrpF [Shewanella basaltis]|uniref:bifunctional indole-3-glycerol-phosphate synthase TrpC/phosphoribosylanthranilate isomerase TrpF n=1 Tax=Shewanella basaltis TaxID=472183 RepID=UPI003AAB0975
MSNPESNVLTRIVDTKVAHIAALKLRYPEASLQPKQSDRSLYHALKAPNAQFILECKKASPSKGLIRADFNVEAIADIYTQYAAGISVLTDEAFFQGDMDYIPRVRARVTQPIICKDFFVDPYQVKLAAHQGADAILLMLSVLDDDQYRLLANEAAKYQLDTLTEVSNEPELIRAIELNAPIIGINNRNLRDLSTDLATTERLAPHIPADRVVISESGIYTHQQTQRLNPLVDGYLVGSSIMAQADIDLACRQLIYGNNKVCGLTRIDDIAAAAKAGAVFGGLIFHPKSPRAVSAQKAAELIAQMQQQHIALNMVGVFVNEQPEIIANLAQSLKLFAVQLHGNETTLEIDALRALFTQKQLSTQIWKAVAIDSQTGEVANKPQGADKYLYDSKSAEQFGGTGHTFNWQADIDNKANAMLAGGLTPDNVYQASQQGFYGVDINSGVESSPGHKDHQKLIEAFTQLRRN